MNRMILAMLAGLAALSGSALAADLPQAPMSYKAPPAMAPVYSWTGFYINGGGGYGLWQANETTTAFPSGICVACATQTLGGKGYFGTVGGGFDYQFSDHIVAGLLADYDFMSLKGTIQDNSAFTTGQLKETSAWAAGARIGWLVTPQIFSYVNGGATGTRFGGSSLTGDNGGPALTTTPAFTKTGWFFGGGTETTLTPFLPSGWFLRSEYRYSSFGSSRVTRSFGGVPVDNINFKPVVQTISTSIVYKFNWMGH